MMIRLRRSASQSANHNKYRPFVSKVLYFYPNLGLSLYGPLWTLFFPPAYCATIDTSFLIASKAWSPRVRTSWLMPSSLSFSSGSMISQSLARAQFHKTRRIRSSYWWAKRIWYCRTWEIIQTYSLDSDGLMEVSEGLEQAGQQDWLFQVLYNKSTCAPSPITVFTATMIGSPL